MADPSELRERMLACRPDISVALGEGELLATALTAAKEAWPTIAVPWSDWIVRVGRALPKQQPLAKALSAMALTDLYLVAAIEANVEGAHKQFGAILTNVLDEAVRAVRGSNSIEAELTSRVMTRVLGPRESSADGEPLAPAIFGYAGRCRLVGWLRLIAVREGIKLVKAAKRTRQFEDSALFGALVPELGADVVFMKKHYRETVRDAFAAALAGLGATQRTLLRQCVIDELTLDQMAPLHNVGRSTIGRWLQEARAQVAEATRTTVSAKLDIPISEVDSILRLVKSQLDITLGPLRDSAAESEV